MQIKSAKVIGPCYGVQRAIDMVQNALDTHKSVYTLGKLTHNDAVVNSLNQKGACVINSETDANPNDYLVIRSHGVAKKVYDYCNLHNINVIDATCPNVSRIHKIVRDYKTYGWDIVIAGEIEHPEVIGINGWCDDSAYIVSTPEQCNRLPFLNRICLVAQTTFAPENYSEIAEVLKLKCNELRINSTICETTEKRQSEACELSKTCTIMLVLGGKESSNTKRLGQACKNFCSRVYLLQNLCELSLEKIKSDDIIGIVSGASTPDWIIREVITRMNELENTMAEGPITQNSQVEEGATTAFESPVTTGEPVATEQIIEQEPVDITDQPEADVPVATEQTIDQEPAAVSEKAEADEPVDDSNGESSFEEAFEKTLVRIRSGQIIKGSVVQIVDGEVSVNIGYKSDGYIPKNEFSSDPEINPADVVKVGDEIEVEVLKVNDGEGNVLLSRKNLEGKRAWEELLQDDYENKIYEGIGKEVVKGGLIANINGIRAFVPASHLSIKYVENISEFVGQTLRLKIIEVDKSRKRIVASQKEVLLGEAENEKKKKWGQLVVGTKMNGVVRRITDFGAFVDIGGIDGLVHVTDVAWGRVKHPSDVLSIGQEIEVLVLNVDMQKERVSLGYKQLQPKPWTLAAEKYPVGSIVSGKVVRIVPFGAFVALEPTIDGLIHISQVGVRRIAKVEDEINVGDIVKCKVLDVNSEAKRISLSRKEVILEENPEIALEIAQEKADRERAAAERAERAEQKTEHRAVSANGEQPKRRQEKPRQENSSNEHAHADRERKPRKEDTDYALPPVQQATTPLASFFSNFTPDDDESQEQ